jgi:amidase
MADIALRPAHQLAEAIRRREFSSRELLEHYLARVERLNAPLNASSRLTPTARAARRMPPMRRWPAAKSSARCTACR